MKHKFCNLGDGSRYAYIKGPLQRGAPEGEILIYFQLPHFHQADHSSLLYTRVCLRMRTDQHIQIRPITSTLQDAVHR